MEEHSIKQQWKEEFDKKFNFEAIFGDGSMAKNAIIEFIETNFIPRSKVEEAIGEDDIIDTDYPVDIDLDLAINKFRSHLRTQLLEGN